MWKEWVPWPRWRSTGVMTGGIRCGGGEKGSPEGGEGPKRDKTVVRCGGWGSVKRGRGRGQKNQGKCAKGEYEGDTYLERGGRGCPPEQERGKRRGGGGKGWGAEKEEKRPPSSGRKEGMDGERSGERGKLGEPSEGGGCLRWGRCAGANTSRVSPEGESWRGWKK